MCTAINFTTKDNYFGRNLDLERSYGERVIITPRNYKFSMGTLPSLDSHYAMIGMGVVVEDYPLYFEATNEKGLSMAGLNFPDNAHYNAYREGKDNVAPFEFIPYILGKCADLGEAKDTLADINLVDMNFSEDLPLSPLHWIISDRHGSITVESVKEGLMVYDNPFGVLTNNPPFPWHMINVNNYMSLSENYPENKLSQNQSFNAYSLGMGALGLPGDFSSASRFVKAVFVKEKSPCLEGENESVSHFFHMLYSVAMPKGCVMTRDGECEYTRYSCCCNTDKGMYYYTTYGNMNITAVDMHSVNIDAREIYTLSVID